MHCYLLTNCNNSWLTLIFTREVFTSVKHPVANIQQPNLEVTMIAKKKFRNNVRLHLLSVNKLTTRRNIKEHNWNFKYNPTYITLSGHRKDIYMFDKINRRATKLYRADTFYIQWTSKGIWFRTPEELRLMEDETVDYMMCTENVSRKCFFF